MLGLALAPSLAAIAAAPWFVTQDGPAHLYNAEIIARSFGPDSPFRAYYDVRWEPLPNWAGHLVLVGLLEVMAPRQADRVMVALTLVGFAASIVWLRARVAGGGGLPVAAVLATLIALNLAWLLGFYSFLLGACAFSITLGVWWRGRDGLGPGRVAALMGWLVLGYFCHLVSLGLTVVGLLVLTVCTPGPDRRRRTAWTVLSLVPLVPLAWIYRGLTRRGGGMHPVWEHLEHPFSPRAWVKQLVWIDPLSLASKVALPFRAATAPAFALTAPALLVVAALALTAWATARAARSDPARRAALRERRGWLVLAAGLVLGGLIGPDTLGLNHGHYLPQRVALLGLVALVPALDLDTRGPLARLAGVALAVALTVQSAFVWDYAVSTSHAVGALQRARAAVGTGQRVVVLLNDIRGRFRANPLMHAGDGLGVGGTGNIVWNNYETRFYYFPVQFRPGLDRPDPAALEAIALRTGPGDARWRAGLWGDLLERHHRAIDAVVVWGRDDATDALNARRFVSVFEDGPVRVLRPRP